MKSKNCILTQADAARKMQRMALEIVEQLHNETNPIYIIGVRSSGTIIAKHIAALVQPHFRQTITVLEVQLPKHQFGEVQLSATLDFNGANIIVVDDVANSGSTLMYALKPLLAYYPKRIQTLVLVERMHKLFPIKPDYVGMSIATTLEDHITVEVHGDVVEGAYI
jgi:pyrimidine operon attenuation protein/uracil phosphoribosyltransferase